jgi:hypothetical protein
MQECPSRGLGPNQLTVMTHDAGHLTKSPSSRNRPCGVVWCGVVCCAHRFVVFLASGELPEENHMPNMFAIVHLKSITVDLIKAKLRASEPQITIF